MIKDVERRKAHVHRALRPVVDVILDAVQMEKVPVNEIKKEKTQPARESQPQNLVVRKKTVQ